MVRSRSRVRIIGVIGIVRALAVGWRLEQFERRLQLFAGRSQVLKQFDLTIKVYEEGFVFLLHQHLFEETAACISLRVEDAGLTTTGVNGILSPQRRADCKKSGQQGD